VCKLPLVLSFAITLFIRFPIMETITFVAFVITAVPAAFEVVVHLDNFINVNSMF